MSGQQRVGGLKQILERPVAGAAGRGLGTFARLRVSAHLNGPEIHGQLATDPLAVLPPEAGLGMQAVMDVHRRQ